MAHSTPTTDLPHDRDTALARSLLYGFLARALAFPSAERLSQLRRHLGPAVVATTAGDPRLGRLAHEAVAALDGTDVELRRGHTRTFPPIESQEHPAYESAYASGDIFVQTQVMADVAGFYRAHGVTVGGPERERPDHIGTELEFMGFMARKEAVALDELGDGEVAECRRTQRHFLRDHLGCWGPAFGERLALSAPGDLYPRLGRLIRAWLDGDIAALDVVPARLLDTPHPPPPPDDGACGLDAEVTGAGEPGAAPAATPVDCPTPGRRTAR
ncbi:MAG TPA: molecular chaperone TorD family protein [Acidimicrobiales bacterium]